MYGKTKKIKDMTTEEKREYQRLATAAWRERNPGNAKKVRDKRRAVRASETPVETAARRAKEIAYYEANKVVICKRAKERRLENYEESRRREKEASERHRAANLEKVREQDRLSHKRNYAKAKPTIKAHNKLRRARQKGATNTEVIYHSVVAERDGWVCHLCSETVTRQDWSIDHLVPLSQGGDHTYANVKLAHRLCNVRRYTKPLA